MIFFKQNACIKYFGLIGLIAFFGGIGFLYSGVYPMGADVPHNKLTYWILETLREQSIARASKEIQVPADLESVDRLLAGGADYNDMCTGCHLKPGKVESDFTLGLYPSPPNLTQVHRDHGHKNSNHEASTTQPIKSTQQEQRLFWIIKHGIKASGMPAWGPGHDDERIWNMVAFIKKLPNLSLIEYQILTARGENDSGHH